MCKVAEFYGKFSNGRGKTWTLRGWNENLFFNRRFGVGALVHCRHFFLGAPASTPASQEPKISIRRRDASAPRQFNGGGR
jgi:hypothetical protein